MNRLTAARRNLEFARNYTLRLLEQTPREQWLQVPAAGVSHIAWQVGHLAMAEYRLALARVRPRTAHDADLIRDQFLLEFGRDSVPNLSTDVEVVWQTFQKVHTQVLAELGTWTEEELLAPLLAPHSIATTKIEAIEWCVHHELLHAGQIGLLRRQLGHPPLW